MKIQIYYQCNSVDLISALCYFFPNKEKKIMNIVMDLHYNDNIYISDNNISTKLKTTDDYLKISDRLFINCISILKECTDESFAININNEKDYILLRHYFINNNFYNELFFDRKCNLKLIINKEIYVITTEIYEEFFNIKLINSTDFIRSTKIKQIL